MTEATSLRTAPTRRVAALLGIAACLVLAGCGRGASKPESAPSAANATGGAESAAVIPINAPIEKETGHAWIVKTDVDPGVRKLHLFEDGKELGPGDSMHDDIRKKGNGAYSHWNPHTKGFFVYFSTSDNSDPNTNGRTYTLK